jgi:hypothetical protein
MDLFRFHLGGSPRRQGFCDNAGIRRLRARRATHAVPAWSCEQSPLVCGAPFDDQQAELADPSNTLESAAPTDPQKLLGTMRENAGSSWKRGERNEPEPI